MSKVFVGIAAFFAGCLFSAVVGTTAQSVNAASPEPALPPGVVSVFGNPDGQPRVSGVLSTIKNVHFEYASQLLDGINFENATFKDANLVYGGGAFSLKNVEISGTTHVMLIGAAANTASLLNLMNGIKSGVPAINEKPNTPIKSSNKARKPLTKFTWKAPYPGGQ